VSRFQFVDDHHTTHGVKRLCQVLGLNRSSFYRWRAGRDARAARRDADKAMVKRMREYHQEFDGTIGVRRMTIELNEKADQPINHKRVERLMRTHNIVGVNLRKPKKTTVKDQGARVVDDFLKRKFRAEAPNQVYVGDITYLPCGQGQFLYLATVIDVCSRRLVGWSIADHMRTSLVEDALENAARARGSLAGAVFHSDHGRQYTSSAFQTTCRRLGVRQSMGRIGSSADNAMAESFNASLKRETLQGARGWDSAEVCRREVFRWVTRYNTRRRHSALDYRSPLAFETATTAATVGLVA